MPGMSIVGISITGISIAGMSKAVVSIAGIPKGEAVVSSLVVLVVVVVGVAKPNCILLLNPPKILVSIGGITIGGIISIGIKLENKLVYSLFGITRLSTNEE